MLRLVVATSLLVLVAGCTDDPEPKEPKPATSATPTATAPTMPAQAKENTPEGATAFLHHYIETFNYAANTGDLGELKNLSAPSCKGCQKYIKFIGDTYAQGGKVDGLQWTPTTSEIKTLGSKTAIWQNITSKESTGTVKYRLYFAISDASDRVVEKLERADA